MTADFHVTIHNRKMSTLWDTEASKPVISEKCQQKIHCTHKVHPCTGIRLSSASASNISTIGILTASGSNISPIGILTLNIGLGIHKFKQIP